MVADGPQNRAPQGSGAGVLAYLILCVPLFFNLWVIARYAVNIPVFDQWWMGSQWAQATLHGWSSPYIHWQANDSRPIVPLFISFGLAHVTHWNSIAEMILSQLLMLFTAAGLVVVARRTIVMSRSAAVALAGITGALLMSPAQTENVLWAIQQILYYPAACLVACMLIAGSRWRLSVQVAVSAALCGIATYSYANGMSLWLLVPFLFLPRLLRAEFRTRLLVAVFWFAAAAVTLWRYFTNYAKPAASLDPGLLVTHFLDASRRFILYLGAPLSVGPHQTYWAYGIGVMLFLVVVGALGWLMASRRRATLLPRATPWLVLMAYGLIAGLAIVSGRFENGIEHALASRYIAFSSCVHAGTLYLAALVIGDLPVATRGTVRWIAASGLVAIVVLHLSVVPAVLPAYADLWVVRLQARAATWLVPQLPYADLADRITFYMKPDDRSRAVFEEIDRRGWLPTGLLREYRDGIGDASGTGRFGIVEQMSTTAGFGYSISGWCARSEHGDPCDAVVVSGALRDGSDRLCGVIFPALHRPELPITAGTMRRYGFQGTALCSDATDLQVWAVDATELKLNRLAR